MADVEEGEIVEIDFDAPPSRPGISQNRRTPEMMGGPRVAQGFLPGGRLIESFDYHHGQWLDRWNSPCVKQRNEFVERSNSDINYFRPIEKMQEIPPRVYNKWDRPHFEAGPMHAPWHPRGHFIGRRRRTFPSRVGRNNRLEKERERFGKDSIEFIDNGFPGGGGFRTAEFHHAAAVNEENWRYAPSHTRMNQSRQGWENTAKDSMEGRFRNDKDNAFLTRFEKIDRSRELNVRNSSNNDGSSTQRTEIDDDEYNLDDYQLLLERHRLIQQQLSVIGQQERDLKETLANKSFSDDFSDFILVPNPNSPCDSEATAGLGNATSESHIENQHVLGAKVQISEKIVGAKQELEMKINENGGAIMKLSENDASLRTSNVLEINAENHTEAHPEKFMPQQVDQSRTSLQKSCEIIATQQKVKGKRKKRRERKKWLKQRLRENLQGFQKTSQSTEKVGPKDRASESANEGIVAEKKRKLDTMVVNDDYQSVPMDLEDEYEEIDSFVDAEYFENIPLVKEDNIVVQDPPTQRVETSAMEAVDENEVPVEQLNTTTTTTVDSNQGEKEDVDKQAEDDVEDDLFLREQLLQSLATKRAEKAKSIIENQQQIPTPAHQRSSNGKTIRKDVLPKRELTIKRTFSPSPAPFAATATTSTSSALTASISNDRRDVNIAKYFDSASRIEAHQKLVIRIGSDSDTDEDHDNTKDEGLFEGAINDLIKEARHGNETEVTQPSKQLSTKEDQRKTNYDGMNQTSPNQGESLQQNLEHCISNATERLAANKLEISKEANAISLLQKKIAIRKSRIEQQDSKIDKLKQMLSAAELTKKTLSAQCFEFQTKIKLFTSRIKLRNEKSRELEDKLQKATAILNSNNSVKKHTLNSLKRNLESGKLPVKSDQGKPSNLIESKKLLIEQINRSIAKMKQMLAKDRNSLTSKLAKDGKDVVEVPFTTKGVSGTPQAFIPKGGTALQSEKDRLQKLERELRIQLDLMKKQNVTKQLTNEGNVESRALGLRREKKALKITSKTQSPKKTSSSSIQQVGREENVLMTSVSNSNNNIDVTDVSKTIEQRGSREVASLQNVDTENGNDLKTVINNRVETKLGTLFQDEEKLKLIKQDQVVRDSMIPDITNFHPHSIADLGKVETGEREKESFDDIIMANKRTRQPVKPLYSERFLPYKSPLVLFRSYRLSPLFRTKEKQSIHSSTYSHNVNPMEVICPYDLTGTCLDEKCTRQHASKISKLDDEELLKDILLYEPKLAHILPKDSPEITNRKILQFITRLKQQYGTKISIEELGVLLVDDIRKFPRLKRQSKMSQVFNICFDKRLGHEEAEERFEEREEEKIVFKSQARMVEQEKWKKDLRNQEKAESQELRYFEEKYDIKRNLEISVAENPSDVKSWLLLARQIVSDTRNDGPDVISSDGEGRVLNVLSKALEANPYSEELWTMYLEIFSKRNSSSELREMYVQAADYCRTFSIWWKCLEFERHYEDKIDICLDIIDFVRENRENVSELCKSHRLLETIVFMLRLEMMRKRQDIAMTILKSVLGISVDSSDTQFSMPVLIDEFTLQDLVIAYLVYASVLSFGKLPQILFDPAIGGPSKIVQKHIGVFKWIDVTENNENEIRQFFTDARKKITKSSMVDEDFIDHVMPFYANYIQFEMDVGKIENAIRIADDVSNGIGSSPVTSLMLIRTLKNNLDVIPPGSRTQVDHMISLETDECVYEYAKYLLKTNTTNQAVRLLVDSVTRKFDFSCEREDASLEVGFKAEAISLYKRLLKTSVDISAGLRRPKSILKIDEDSREYAFIWLNLCLLQELTGAVPDSAIFSTGAEESFESAVNAYTTRENREILWLEYVAFKERQIKDSTANRNSMKSLFEVARRCLACMPSTKALPFQTTTHWNDYGFHNKVISRCLQYLPEPEVIQYLKTNLTMMPANVPLALRLCHATLVNRNFELARTIYGVTLETNPFSLEMWQMALSVELMSKKIREARWLYEEATKMLPCSTCLWENFVMFEIGHGQNPRQIQTRIIEIATKATSYGIFIMDYVRGLFR